ncbi:MAG: hypothetical protein ACOYXT_07255 [Bacteroidota bacterium]
MRYLVPIVFLFLLSCDQSKKSGAARFSEIPAPTDHHWVTYEGLMMMEDGHEAVIELSLIPTDVGVDSYYRVDEWIEASNSYSESRTSSGKYTTIYDPGSTEVTIQLFGRTPAEDRFFRSKGDQQFVLLNNQFQQISSNDKHVLVKRSDVFIIEGFITFTRDSAGLSERNSKKQWTISRLGVFPEARNRYQNLAKEPSEAIYIRALAYSVQSNNAKAVVLKKIIEMNSERGGI